MTNEERKRLLAKIARSTKAIQKMSPEEARRRLVNEGIYNEDGSVAARYGGKVAASG
jgi:hypothetical protein